MVRKLHKYKLLLDENFPYRNRFVLLNSRYDVKHIKGDLKRIGLSDPEVYEIACQQNRLIVTFNTKDFITIAEKSNKTGIIGVSTNLTADQIDKKLAALLRRKRLTELFGKYIYISGEV